MPERIGVLLRPFAVEDAPENLRAELAGELMHGITGMFDGQIVGYAGIREVYGRHFGFFHLNDERARQPFFIHRLVKITIDAAESVGITPLFTFCDETHARARLWLIRLGFRELRDDEKDAIIKATEDATGQKVWIREKRI